MIETLKLDLGWLCLFIGIGLFLIASVIRAGWLMGRQPIGVKGRSAKRDLLPVGCLAPYLRKILK